MIEEKAFIIAYPDNTYPQMIIRGEPDFDDWYSLWHQIKNFDRVMPWVLGDMLLYGETAFGEAANQVLEETDQHHFKPGTLRDYKYVARKFPLSSRLYALPWSYYQAVAGLPLDEAMAQLENCVTHGVKRFELRQIARELNGGQQPNPPGNADDTIDELAQANYDKEQRIAELEAQLTEARTILKMDELPFEITLPDEINRLTAPIRAWLCKVGYLAVIIRANGEIVIKP